MGKNIHIDVHHVTRVEGHGNIVVNVTNGAVETCEWRVPEAPRFFEAMVRGRHYTEVARVVSRICGICSVGHSLASVKATEDALGIPVSEQAKNLRRLAKHAENIDSHVVHVLFLVAPDLLGAPSVFPLVPTHGDVVRRALRLKRFGHEFGSALCGRTTHPTRIVPGGFAELPTIDELKELRRRIDADLMPDLVSILGVVASLADKFPVFHRPTEYIALHSDEEYGLYDGDVQSVLPDGTKQIYKVADYRSYTNEYVDPRSTAKYARNKLASYLVGALARFNNNYDQLHPEAKKLADGLGFKGLCFNPYLNSAVQVVEIVHSVQESIRILDDLIAHGIREEEPGKPTKHGAGSSAVEVPRGILFHHYSYDDRFMCLGGDCIIPTNQNHANIQLDFEKLVPEMLAANKDEKQMELGLEMLVRAYDPCISCSTHYLDVRFVR
jgi:coenzyme F420-reducing hydrogenase alpha subunit